MSRRTAPRLAPTLQRIALVLLTLTALGAGIAHAQDDGLLTVRELVPGPLEPSVPPVLLDLAIPGPDHPNAVQDLIEAWLASVPPELVNDDGRACIEIWSAAYAGGFLGSMITPPGPDLALSTAAYYANLALKTCSPLFLRPPDIAFEPNTPDQCRYESAREASASNRVQRTHEKRGFLFNLDSPLPSPHDTDWGPLGTPDVSHYNTGVAVLMSEMRDSRGFVTWANEFDPNLATTHPSNPEPEMFLELPVGTTTVEWTAASLFTDLDGVFIYIPQVPPGWKVPAATDFVVELALDLGVLALGQYDEVIPTYVSDGTVIELEQTVEVYDRIPPEVDPIQVDFVFEGTELGGASLRTALYAQQLREGFTVDDPCGGPLTLVPPPRAIWPVGQQTDVVWTVLDEGPNPDSPRADRRNETTFVQRVTVVDTLAPTIKPMRGAVVERPAGQTGDVVVDLPGPEVFDFVDASVQVGNDAPAGNAFPLGAHTVTWTATDQSGNTSTAQQIVNVKAEGTNTAPVATPRVATEAPEAESFTETEIELAATDADGDPLWFEIASPPDNGFFVAPLLPYFFGDVRGTEGPWASRCSRPTHALWDPEYVKILDDGRIVVLHAPAFAGCPGGTFEKRISIYPKNWEDISIRQQGRDMTGLPTDLYGGLEVNEDEGFMLYSRNDFGTPSFLKLDLNEFQFPALKDYRMPVGDPARKGVIDVLPDGREVLYVTTTVVSGRVDVYDLTRANASASVQVQLGAADKLGSYVLSPSGEQPALDIGVDSKGNLYASQLGAAYNDRLHKFSPVTIDSQGELVLGEHVGWMGACTGGTGCDGSTLTSRGYSCSDGTCTPGTTTATRSGPGQFDRLGGIAVDPNDILYVTEWGGNRIQRFTPEGYFAGQARSDCDEELCFVLGQFANPRHVAVNSTQFVVLDTALDVLHIFDTGVVELTSPTTAKVTYKSESGFLGTDSFEFVATDGLVESAPATVEVAVSRGYHEPRARGDVVYLVDEDTPSPVFLAADDPDFPLDTFTYTIVEPPKHGTLEGEAPNFSYVPDPDFFGEDSLTYTVNDGFTESAPASPRIVVRSVNDAPRVAPVSERVVIGAHYEARFEFAFTDAEPGDVHTGQFTYSGGLVVQDYFTNVDFVDGAGVGFATHRRTYTVPGLYDVEFCVTDDGIPARTGCATMEIEVVAAADLIVTFDHTTQPILLGNDFRRVVKVEHYAEYSDRNDVPAAEDVELVVTLPEAIDLRNVYATQGDCTVEPDGAPGGGRALVCGLGTLQPLQKVEVSIVGNLASEPGAIRAYATSSTPDPHEPNDSTTWWAVRPDPGYGPEDTLVLFGEAVTDGSITATVAGEEIRWDFQAGDSAYDALILFTIEIYNSQTLIDKGVFPSVDGFALRVNAQLEDLAITPGSGLEPGIPVAVENARLELDFDSLGSVASPAFPGVVYVGPNREIHVPRNTVSYFRGTMPQVDFEVTALRVENSFLLGGSFTLDAEDHLVGTDRSRIVGTLQIDQFDPNQVTETWISAAGGTGTSEAPMGTDRTFRMTNDANFGTRAFTLEAWDYQNGTTGERSYAGVDLRNESGTEGIVRLVSPMVVEIESSDGLERVIPGGATLSFELVPEPSARLLGVAAVLCLSALRRRRPGRSSAAGGQEAS